MVAMVEMEEVSTIKRQTVMISGDFQIMGGLIVLLIFNNYTFQLTNGIFGNVLTRRNCPTLFGYVLHTFVYILLVRLSMGY